ncbi:MAG TPA: class I SAM-dependent methyltransferase [Solirubrobacteraceae bacterium]|nr:class I SAM-dependent methyltransferase [Solirubrobacteraceae bacterium]
MIRSALHVYGDGLERRHELLLRQIDGTATPLALPRWLGPPDGTDESVIRRARGPVLDVGCGPGRHLHALARRGVYGLGVDLSPVAVALARDRGAIAVVGSIFDEIPGAGTWRTALLLDGNIGIGGDPVRLLQRVRALLHRGGEMLVELDPPDAGTKTVTVRLEADGDASGWFSWARVAIGDLDAIARLAGLRVAARWRRDERWFARLHMSK